MINYNQYEKFIKTNSMCDFMQSLKWNNIKTYWQNEQIIITRHHEIKLALNILIRKVPIFGNYMYIPRGPIGDIHNEVLLAELTTKLKLIAKKYHAFIILMEPDIKVDDHEFITKIKKLGYKINNTSTSFQDEIQARHNLRLNLEGKTEDEVFNSFSKKTRYNIRLAMKKGIEIKEEGIDGLETFYNLLKITGKRDNFIIRPINYYASLFNEFNDITIFIAYYNNTPIAGIMPLTYGNKTWYLHGASSNEYRNLMPNYLLQWYSIKRAINKKSIIYDFKGFSFKNNEPDGLYKFKKGFGTDYVELTGEVYLDIKPIKYYFFKKSKKLYCKLRKLKYNLTNKK